MLEFKLDESNYFEFQMEITGDILTSSPPEVAFNLTLKNGIKMSFLAERKDDVYAVTIPPMNDYDLNTGDYDFNLSVILADKYFSPHAGKCTFKQDPKPVITNLKVEQQGNPAIKMTAPPVTFVQKPVPTVTPIVAEEETVVEVPPVIEEPKVDAAALMSFDKLLKRNKEK